MTSQLTCSSTQLALGLLFQRLVPALAAAPLSLLFHRPPHNEHQAGPYQSSTRMSSPSDRTLLEAKSSSCSGLTKVMALAEMARVRIWGWKRNTTLEMENRPLHLPLTPETREFCKRKKHHPKKI